MSDTSDVFRRNPDAAYRVYDGQATIVIPNRAAVHVLNPVGTMVWGLIDGVRTVGQIVDAVTTEYEAPSDEVRRDVLAFVSDLRQNGMVS